MGDGKTSYSSNFDGVLEYFSRIEPGSGDKFVVYFWGRGNIPGLEFTGINGEDEIGFLYGKLIPFSVSSKKLDKVDEIEKVGDPPVSVFKHKY